MSLRKADLRAVVAMLAMLLVAFAIGARAASPTFQTLYQFTGYLGTPDGYQPNAPVVIGPGGVLYGTTRYGGIMNCQSHSPSTCGTVFMLTPSGSPNTQWAETLLHSFAGGADGGWPTGAVVIGSGGVLYGTTGIGGTSDFGTVYSLTPPASPGGSWTEAVLYSFAARALPGATGPAREATSSSAAKAYFTVSHRAVERMAGARYSRWLLRQCQGACGSKPCSGVLGTAATARVLWRV